MRRIAIRPCPADDAVTGHFSASGHSQASIADQIRAFVQLQPALHIQLRKTLKKAKFICRVLQSD